jgi:hypothetical protein
MNRRPPIPRLSQTIVGFQQHKAAEALSPRTLVSYEQHLIIVCRCDRPSRSCQPRDALLHFMAGEWRVDTIRHTDALMHQIHADRFIIRHRFGTLERIDGMTMAKFYGHL